MAIEQSSSQEQKNGRRAAPRRWSGNLLSKTGPVARFFGMEREARKLASEGTHLKSSGNLQGAFIKFQLAASKEKEPGFGADLHEIAADTMFEIAGLQIEAHKKKISLLTAAEEYRYAAVKRAKADPEKAAMLYVRAGTISLQVGAADPAKHDFQQAFDLTGKQRLRNWLRAQIGKAD